MKNLISVDLEDWHTSAYLAAYVKKTDICHRITEAAYPILEVFERKGVKATFFVLGSIAEQFPDLIKDIARKGHELASHGYSHTPLWRLTGRSFRDELRKTNRIIEDTAGIRPSGFRAPWASLDASTAWAVDILGEEGFKYDSSIFPVLTPLYGAPGAPVKAYRISARNIARNSPGSPIVEIPFTVACFGAIRIPCTGGFYGRVMPFPFLKYLLKTARRNGPVNFYFHPWETCARIPRIKVPVFNAFVSYYNAGNYLKKIEALLDCWEYMPFNTYVDSLTSGGAQGVC